MTDVFPVVKGKRQPQASCDILFMIILISAREIGNDKYSKMSHDSIIILKEIFKDQRWHEVGGFVMNPLFTPLPPRYRGKI